MKEPSEQAMVILKHISIQDPDKKQLALAIDVHTAELRQRIERLESSLRDREPTYAFGGEVMNRIVLKRTNQILTGEIALNALLRWIFERDQAVDQCDQLKSRVREFLVWLSEREKLAGKSEREWREWKGQCQQATYRNGMCYAFHEAVNQCNLMLGNVGADTIEKLDNLEPATYGGKEGKQI